jgi:hypothetical protein
MKSEEEIISRIRWLKYEAQRVSAGFSRRIINLNAIGSPLDMLSLLKQASTLEWVIGREIPVKKINWYQKARKIWRRTLRIVG